MKSHRSSRARFQSFQEKYRADRWWDAEGSSMLEEVGPKRDTKTAGGPGRSPHLRDYLRRLKPHRSEIAQVLLFGIVAVGLSMIEPLFVRFIVDRVLLANGLETSERIARLQSLGLMFGGVIITSIVLGVIRDSRQRLLSVRVVLGLRRSLFRRFLRLPLSKLSEMKTGGILLRLTGDVDTTAGLVQMMIVTPAIAVLRLLLAITIMAVINWQLALAALAVLPVAMMVSFLSSRRVRPIYRAIRKEMEQIDGRAGETFAGIRVVRAFGRELRELRNYMTGRHAILRKELFAHRRELALSASWGLLVASVNLTIICVGGWLFVLNRASVGDIISFQWYTLLLLNPVSSIVKSSSDVQRALAAMERVFAVLELPPEKPDRPDATMAPRAVQGIRFENVSFEYRVGTPVVRNLSFAVPGGSTVALVGRSGAGKTTVTDLVARFQDPTAGRILLNGKDVRDIRLAAYRDLLAIVQQEVFLFDGSVHDNIAYGRRHATSAEVEDAARRANAHSFIVKLPCGYETAIGERGMKLSGGQKQRLAIARAILAAPQILIFDEATSNLDSESEQLIQASIAELLKGRTTFVIAHRLSTIRCADLILLIEDGNVIERGTHDQLMRLSGSYRNMVEKQADATAEV